MSNKQMEKKKSVFFGMTRGAFEAMRDEKDPSAGGAAIVMLPITLSIDLILLPFQVSIIIYNKVKKK